MVKDEQFEVGQRVYIDSFGEKEVGIVLHCWFDEEIKSYDCYVAFFGNSFPKGKPDEIPYVLRYSSTSLIKVEN